MLNNRSETQHSEEFDQVLDSCLTMLQAGDTLETCLSRYPAWADALAPILEFSAEVLTVPTPRASSSAVSTNRSKMMAAVEAQSSQNTELLTFLQPVSFPNLGRYAGQLKQFLVGTEVTPAMKFTRSLAMMAALIFSFAFTLNASADSLPGDMLYQVKRLSEETQEFLAPPARAEEIREQQTLNRLSELEAIKNQNRTGTLEIDGNVNLIDDKTILIDGYQITIDETAGVQVTGSGSEGSSVKLEVVDGKIILLEIDGNDYTDVVDGHSPAGETPTAEPTTTAEPTETPEPPESEQPGNYPYPNPETPEPDTGEEEEQIEACLALEDEAAIDTCLDELFDEIYPIDEEIEACLALEDEEAIEDCLDDLYEVEYPEGEETPEPDDVVDPIDLIDEEELDACLELEDDAEFEACIDDLIDEVMPEDGDTEQPEMPDDWSEEEVEELIDCLETTPIEDIASCFEDGNQDEDPTVEFPELPDPTAYPEPTDEAPEWDDEDEWDNDEDWDDDFDEDDSEFDSPEPPESGDDTDDSPEWDNEDGWDDDFDEDDSDFDSPEPPDSGDDSDDSPEWDNEDGWNDDFNEDDSEFDFPEPPDSDEDSDDSPEWDNEDGWDDGIDEDDSEFDSPEPPDSDEDSDDDSDFDADWPEDPESDEEFDWNDDDSDEENEDGD